MREIKNRQLFHSHVLSQWESPTFWLPTARPVGIPRIRPATSLTRGGIVLAILGDEFTDALRVIKLHENSSNFLLAARGVSLDAQEQEGMVSVLVNR